MNNQTHSTSLKTYKGLLVLLTLLLLPVFALADQLEVRRASDVYSKPSRDSGVLTRLELNGNDGPLLVRLLDDEKVNGYYRIRIPGKNKDGWLYKTNVRRYDQPHPQYRAYDRKLYRHWIDEDGNCRDTRAEVLARDASGKVTYADDRECTVKSGKWKDPYTGAIFTDAKKLDVDHMVPLKNAHESGAWAWSAKKKQDYANYMKTSYHLLAVSLSENRKKGEKGPDKYLPPLASYRCEYVRDWAKIKEDWELEMSEDEGTAVQQILEKCEH